MKIKAMIIFDEILKAKRKDFDINLDQKSHQKI